MKLRFVPALALTLLAAPASQAAPDDSWCSVVGQAAYLVMTHRQLGASIDSVLEIAGDLPLYRAMALEAWQQPRWHTEAARERAATDMRDEWHLACLLENQ